MKADVSQITGLLTWWWLPSFGSQVLLNVLYSTQLLAPPPPNAHRLRNNHLQLARTFVVLATLTYQLYTSIATCSPNHYQLLGLPLDVDAEGIKRSFRSLARRYHPDKVGEQGEPFFILLRSAHDSLSDPVKRFAYDRFGPSVSQWKDCESSRNYMRRGLYSLVAFYTINPAMYALFGYFNSRSDGLSFWRLATLFSLLSFELCLLISPFYPTWLTLLMPNTTIHDVRNLAHSLFVNFFFASLQLSAALDVLEYGETGAPARDRAGKAKQVERQLEVLTLKAGALDRAAGVVANGVLQGFARELRPFASSGDKEESKEGQTQMNEQEEELFARIDLVLLSRSLVQQHPQLAVLAESEAVPEKVYVTQSDEPILPAERVKEEEEGAPPIAEQVPETKVEEASSQEPTPTHDIKASEVKQEELEPSIALTVSGQQEGAIADKHAEAMAVKEEASEVELSQSRNRLTDTLAPVVEAITIVASIEQQPPRVPVLEGTSTEPLVAYNTTVPQLRQTYSSADGSPIRDSHIPTSEGASTVNRKEQPDEANGTLTSG